MLPLIIRATITEMCKEVSGVFKEHCLERGYRVPNFLKSCYNKKNMRMSWTRRRICRRISQAARRCEMKCDDDETSTLEPGVLPGAWQDVEVDSHITGLSVTALTQLAERAVAAGTLTSNMTLVRGDVIGAELQPVGGKKYQIQVELGVSTSCDVQEQVAVVSACVKKGGDVGGDIGVRRMGARTIQGGGGDTVEVGDSFITGQYIMVVLVRPWISPPVELLDFKDLTGEPLRSILWGE